MSARALFRRRDESGISLAEVVVSSVLAVVVLSMGYEILATTQRTAATVTNRALNSTNARQAFTRLEQDIRYANGICAVSGTTCLATPTGAVTTLVVTNHPSAANAAYSDSNTVRQPSCARWSVTAAGLVETANGTATTVMPGLSAVGAGAFKLYSPNASAPANEIVEIDYSVNGEPAAHIVTADAVNVHELITPENLTTLQGTTLTTPPC